MKLKVNYVYTYFGTDTYSFGRDFLVLKTKNIQGRLQYILREYKDACEKIMFLTYHIFDDSFTENCFKINTIETLKWKYEVKKINSSRI